MYYVVHIFLTYVIIPRGLTEIFQNSF
jgi:hypothetical protein